MVVECYSTEACVLVDILMRRAHLGVAAVVFNCIESNSCVGCSEPTCLLTLLQCAAMCLPLKRQEGTDVPSGNSCDARRSRLHAGRLWVSLALQHGTCVQAWTLACEEAQVGIGSQDGKGGSEFRALCRES